VNHRVYWWRMLWRVDSAASAAAIQVHLDTTVDLLSAALVQFLNLKGSRRVLFVPKATRSEMLSIVSLSFGVAVPSVIENLFLVVRRTSSNGSRLTALLGLRLQTIVAFPSSRLIKLDATNCPEF
jgi:hypothetical protein